ncbi:MAG: tetratricopeptide repeat protein, partial [Planctomycetota bacterium]
NGQFPEAIKALETALGLDDSPQIVEFLGGIYARAGYLDKTREMLDELERQAEYRFICPYEVATIYLALGDFDKAFEWFDEAYAQRSPCVPWLNVDPRLDVIRDDARFEALQRATGHEVVNPY